MYLHEIREMVAALDKAGCIAGGNQEKAVEVLQEQWTEKIAITWCVDDVLQEADSLDIELTREEAIEVLHEVGKKHDCNLGITWGTLQSHILMRA